jgi:hypothetical protein
MLSGIHGGGGVGRVVIRRGFDDSGVQFGLGQFAAGLGTPIGAGRIDGEFLAWIQGGS